MRTAGTASMSAVKAPRTTSRPASPMCRQATAVKMMIAAATSSPPRPSSRVCTVLEPSSPRRRGTAGGGVAGKPPGSTDSVGVWGGAIWRPGGSMCGTGRAAGGVSGAGTAAAGASAR